MIDLQMLVDHTVIAVIPEDVFFPCFDAVGTFRFAGARSELVRKIIGVAYFECVAEVL